MTERPLFIALSSPAMGSGKSVVAQHLVDNHGFELVKFAGPLKAMTRALLEELGEDYTVIEARLEGNLKEHVIPALQVSCRRVMQTIGTELGRVCWHENVWADIAGHRASSLLSAGRNVVVDDMRYLNELAAVKSAGGIPLRVTRPGVTVTAAHSSEGELDGEMMTVLDNRGSLDDLYRLVDNTVAYLRDDQF